MRTPSTPEELDAFARAGPIKPVFDREQLLKAKGVRSGGSYRAAPGDLLTLEMPTIMRAMSTSEEKPDHFRCRVGSDGYIVLPEVAPMHVAGKELGDIEELVIAAYHPAYVIHRPSVVATVSDYDTVKVSIAGAVSNPQTFELRSDERSLISLLIKGGVQIRDGAVAVNIHRPGHAEPEIHGLPVMGFSESGNFQDADLHGGEIVEIQQLNPRVFTILGLANSQGTFPYPENVEYNLMQALGFAGGVDVIPDPQSVKIYRQDANGDVVSAIVPIAPKHVKDAYRVKIKPGDVIALDHTLYTTARTVLFKVIQIQLGVRYDINDND